MKLKHGASIRVKGQHTLLCIQGNYDTNSSAIKMATGTQSILTKGEYVMAENAMCYIDKVVNDGGLNIYILVDMDSGRRLVKMREYLQMPTEPVLDGSSFDHIIEEMTGIPEKETKKRFLEVSEDDVETLAMNSNSKRTRDQTVWGINIFKG